MSKAFAISTFILLNFSALSQASDDVPEPSKMAVLGDSGVTGVLTHNKIEATLPSLWRMIREIFELREPLQKSRHEMDFAFGRRIYFSEAEFDQSPWWIKQYLGWQARASTVMDAPENSFAIQLGQKLKISEVILVGQDGQMIKALPQQFSRLIDAESTLPPLGLISFTANDFCSSRVIDRPIAQFQEDFRINMEETWQEAAPFLRAHANGSEIWILAPFDVVNLLENPEVLATAVEIEGRGRTTCHELRRNTPEFAPRTWLVNRVLKSICPSVTRIAAGESVEKLKAIKEIVSSVWRQQIEKLNQTYHGRRIQFKFLEATRTVQFGKGDVGPDCFHPSKAGHQKIAEHLLPFFKK